MTPWQFRCCCDAYFTRMQQAHDHDVWIMWHAEAINRTKRLPPISDFLSKEVAKKKVNEIDEHAIIARLKAYSSRVSTGEQ